MATLVSPGVSVTTVDESFYAPAGAGSVPLIVIATKQDKSSPDGSGTAAYTTSAKADKLYLITSQRELLQNYGNPVFKSSGGTPLHGDELNEYGLLSAYSFLGIANRAYVLRANVDLGALESSSTAPTNAPGLHDPLSKLTSSPDCLGQSVYSTSKGGICITDEMRKTFNTRGGNSC